MDVLDTKEQSVRGKKNFERLKMLLRYECVPLILTECKVKKDSKETYSIVQKGHKIKPK